MNTAVETAWDYASHAAALLAIDPKGLGGLVIKAQPGPVRDAFMESFTSLFASDIPILRLPSSVSEARLVGGIELAATLASGKPVFEQGLLAKAHGGVLIAGMAERMERPVAARLEAALDTGRVRIERDHISDQQPAEFALLLWDESEPGEDAPCASLLDRLAFMADLTACSIRDCGDTYTDHATIKAAQQRLPKTQIAPGHIEILVTMAQAFGIASLRAPLLAAAVARAQAAYQGRAETDESDCALAAAFVLAPRATCLPSPPDAQEQEQEQEQAPPPPPQDNETQQDQPDEQTASDRPLDDKILDAIAAAIPADLLAQIQSGQGGRQTGRGAAAGRKARALRGRPLGAQRGDPRRDRFDVLETLRAAIPWQKLRAQRDGTAIAFRREDLRVRRFRPKAKTTTIFVVDASGSSALHRLAEAKGAVELVLAECYVRRDEAALIAFRGTKAEIIVPPTRSLTRARALLKGLPGGGGTPLALGLDAARSLADTVRRKGDRPFLIVLTDAQANIARDGTGGRAKADEDAQASAQALHRDGFESLLIDTSPRPQPKAAHLAQQMGARYLALPQANAHKLAAAILPHRPSDR